MSMKIIVDGILLCLPFSTKEGKLSLWNGDEYFSGTMAEKHTDIVCKLALDFMFIGLNKRLKTTRFAHVTRVNFDHTALLFFRLLFGIV